MKNFLFHAGGRSTYARFKQKLDDNCKVARVPAHAMRMLLYGLGSGIAGTRLAFCRDRSRPEPARFDLMIATPGSHLPAWIGREWDTVISDHERYECSARLYLVGRREADALEKRLKWLRALMLDHSGEALMARDQLAFRARFRPMRPLHRMDAGRPPASRNANGKDIVLAAAGSAHVRRCLRNAGGEPCSGDATRLSAWLPMDHLRKIARRTPLQELARLAWILQAPQGRSSPSDSGLGGVSVFGRLEAADLHFQTYEFQPDPLTRAHLEAVRIMMDRFLSSVPECIRNHAVPGADLEWHLAAVASAIHDGTSTPMGRREDDWRPQTAIDALLLLMRHVHNLRLCYPCDSNGFFEGEDLKLFRNLSETARSTRDLQRSGRGIQKATLVAFLRRAMDAGLACEPVPGRFATAPQPDLDVSDFVSEFAGRLQEAARKGLFDPDNTDKPAGSHR